MSNTTYLTIGALMLMLTTGVLVISDSKDYYCGVEKVTLSNISDDTIKGYVYLENETIITECPIGFTNDPNPIKDITVTLNDKTFVIQEVNQTYYLTVEDIIKLEAVE